MVKKTIDEIQKNRQARRELIENYRLDRDALEAEYLKQMRELVHPRKGWNPKPKIRL